MDGYRGCWPLVLAEGTGGGTTRISLLCSRKGRHKRGEGCWCPLLAGRAHQINRIFRKSVLVQARSRRPISPALEEETSELGRKDAGLSSMIIRPRTPPGAGKRQGSPLASCARGRRHTRSIVFSDRRCSFTRARLRLNGPPVQAEEHVRKQIGCCGTFVKATSARLAGRVRTSPTSRPPAFRGQSCAAGEEGNEHAWREH